MSKTVYVVTSTDLGWDCVCGVYATYELAEKACKPSEEEYNEDPEWYDKHLNSEGMFDDYIIHVKKLEEE